MTPDAVKAALPLLAKLENLEKIRRAFRGVAKAKIVVEAHEGSPAYNIGGAEFLTEKHAREILETLAEEARAELRRLGVEMEGDVDER